MTGENLSSITDALIEYDECERVTRFLETITEN